MDLLDLFVKISVDDQASGKLGELSGKLGNGLKTAAKIGTAAVAAVGGGISALGAYAAKVGGDFEAQMSKVSAISGATGDDLQALEDKAKQLGIDTKFSATEAGQAFEYMAMAGWKTEQMLDGVAGIMDLAAASGENLALVSDIVTDAMTAFGLSADQSTHFADVLAQASSNANTNVALLGESFKYVAPVAGALGYSVEDTATALGLMANAGIKGSQAGTALRAALSSMLDASDPAYTAMMKLGLATEDTVTALVNEDGTTKSLAETMRILRDAFSGLTEAEQAEYASNIFGREAMSGMLAIINTSDAEFEKLTNSIYSADGAAKNMADTMANNLQGQLTLLKSSAEGFGLALYDKIQTPLTEMTSLAVDSLNQLTTAFNENGVNGVVEAAGNILSEAITTVVDKLPEFVELAVSIIESFVNGLSQSIQGFGPSFMQFVQQLLSMIQSGIINGLPVLAESAATIMGNFGSYLQKNLPTLLQSGLSAVSTLTGSIRENAGVLVDGALALAQSLAKGLADSIPTIVETVPTIVTNIAGVINDNAPKIFLAAANIMSTLAKGLISAIPTIVANLPQIINAIVDVLLAFNWINLGTSVIKGFANGIKSMVSFVKNSANGIGTAVKNGLASLPAEMVNIGKNIIQGLINGVKSLASAVKSNIKSVVGGAVSTVKNFLGIHSPSTVFYSIGEYIMQGLELGLQDSAGNVMETVENIVAELKKRFDTIANIYTTRQDISDLEYQLWEGSEGKNATEAEKYAKKLQLLTKQQNDQQNVVDAAVTAYQKIVEQYGDNTQESYEYQKTLLEEQLELQNLQNEIYDTIAAMQELSKTQSGMSSVSFGESGLGTATSATINATEAVADREISASFTANLVTPDGSKLASWQLPYLIKAGSAAGTPIAEAQRA